MTSPRTRLALIAALLVLALGLPGLPRTVASIGLSIQGERSNRFYQQLRLALTRKARTHSYRLIVRYAGDDPAVQQEQVEDFIQEHVNAIVLIPVDSRDIDPAILEANRAGIPVFTVDIRDLPGAGKVVASVTSDNYSGGFAAGNELCKGLDPTVLERDRMADAPEGAQVFTPLIRTDGEIAILDEPGISSVEDRVRGFKRVIKECGISLTNKPIVVDAGRQADTAKETMLTILHEHPNLRAVFATNDTLAIAALDAFSEAQKNPKEIPIVGYDDGPVAQKKVELGDIRAEIAQDPECLASVTMEQVSRVLKRRFSLPPPENPATFVVPITVHEHGGVRFSFLELDDSTPQELDDSAPRPVKYQSCDGNVAKSSR